MIDFHAHLDLYPNPHMIVKEVTERGIYVLSVTTTPSAWRGTGTRSTKFTHKDSMGLHPQIAHERISELPLFDSYLSETMYVGEIGLDGDTELKKHWQTQLIVFDHILPHVRQLAGGSCLYTVVVATPVLDRITELSSAGIPVLHWFSGSKRELRRAIDLGCWFSIYQQCLHLRRLAGLCGKCQEIGY